MNSLLRYLSLSRQQLATLLIVIVFAVAGSTLIFYVVDTNEKVLRQRSFSAEAYKLIATIEKEITTDLETVLAINALYEASEFVSREEFRVFTRHILYKRSSIQALSWIPLVTLEEQPYFEKMAIDDGIAGFQFKERTNGQLVPVKPRPYYLPVYYIEPVQGNEAAVGFDLASNPARKKALLKADSISSLTATSRLNLVQETTAQKGILFIYPIKHEDVLSGYFTGVYRINDMILKAVDRSVFNTFNLVIFDRSAEEGDQLLAQFGGTRMVVLPENAIYTPPIGIHQTRTISVGDREWQFVVTPSAPFHGIRMAVLALLLTSITFLLLISYLYSNYSQLTRKNRSDARQLKKNEELRQFTYIASHDLQEPLTTIKNFTHLMTLNYPTEQHKSFRNFIKEMNWATNYMSTLINGLLNYSLVGFESIKSSFDIDLLVRDVMKTVIAEKNITDVDVLIGDLPEIRANEKDMRTLFYHLISNAMDYRKPNHPLQVRIYSVDKKDHWKFAIRDNGVGMPHESRNEVFKLFFRLNRKGRKKGRGIGLAICKKIVETHGGKIWINSEPGIGTIVTFTISKNIRSKTT